MRVNKNKNNNNNIKCNNKANNITIRRNLKLN